MDLKPGQPWREVLRSLVDPSTPLSLMPLPRIVAAPLRLTSLVAALPVLVIFASPEKLAAQQQQQPPIIAGMTQSGPIIQSTGRSVKVDDATFMIPNDHVFKTVYVIDTADSTGANQQLSTIARFLNLSARNGVPNERVHAAAVVHGSGWMSLLSDSAYGARFSGKANPSKQLVEELLANGVQLVLCGQTAGFRGVKRDELIPGIQVAISAMSALNVFQAQGYQFNPW